MENTSSIKKPVSYTDLRFLTKAHTNPGEKSRIYFCCHPEEQHLFLKDITDEIFSVRDDIVFWYLPASVSEPDIEKLQDDICQMELMAVIVTSRFLNEKNRGRLWEFQYALDRKINILPIIMEENLETRFNEMYGNIQCLKRYDAANTPYRSSLSVFLTDYLHGDLSSSDIREAFRAHVFLSYRKKDRKYIQPLLHEVHRLDFMRDVAVWYDDYLIPGEHFDDTILQKLNESDAVILLVTPSILEPDNYVLETEYPFALRKGKTIIPVEMNATPRDILLQKYDRLPPVADGYNSKQLEDALKILKTELKLLPTDETAEHLYKIGSAYLYGIGTETDSVRAEQLLIKAAEKKYAPAMKKLAGLYQGKNGITRDMPKSTEWQKKYADSLEVPYDNDRADVFRKFYELGRLGESCHSLGEYQRSINIFQEALDLIDRWIASQPSREICEYTFEYWTGYSDMYLKMAESYARTGDTVNAKRCFREALTTDYNLDQNPEVGGYRTQSNLAMAYMHFGQFLVNEEELNLAEEVVGEAARLLDQTWVMWMPSNDKTRVYKTAGGTDRAEEQFFIRSHLRLAYEFLAEIAMRKTAPDTAMQHYIHAQLYAYWLYKNSPSEDTIKDFLIINLSMYYLSDLVRRKRTFLFQLSLRKNVKKYLKNIHKIEEYVKQMPYHEAIETLEDTFDIFPMDILEQQFQAGEI